MKFDQLYSSSSGNLYIIEASNRKRLMLECGVRWPRIQKALNYNLSDIVGCLITHEHKDHSRAALQVMKAGIRIYASEGTCDALKSTWQEDSFAYRKLTCLWHELNSESTPLNGGFYVKSFAANHDAAEPMMFVVCCDGEYLLFAPDTSHINYRFKMPFSIIAIECSYDIDVLKARVDTGTINETVAKRLLSSHMEKQVTMDYIATFCDLSKCREIHLLHMSGDNISKEKTRKEFEDRFFIETKVLL